jgi:signal transduction histidine kinase/response regulator RpfG family c-di-GMP phosphodiesterase
MNDDLEQKLALSQARCVRLKKARTEAENLLELKSRELFEANQLLEANQLGLTGDIKQATYELSITNQRLQGSLNERSAFIGQMSHEVRTPLNAIIGLSEILLKSELDDTQTDYIDTINSGAKSLIVLLNDMLDITKIEAGRVELKPQAGDTQRIHNNIISMFRLEARSKGLTLELRIDKTVPKRISIDAGRYKQIINNLISNAIKNTNQGGVLVDISYQSNVISENMGMLKVKVVDTGVGIPKDQIKRIFNAYEQIGNPDQGVGLGLAICQQLSELMMGKISCESKVGRGSIFQLDLPVQELKDIEENVARTKNSKTSALPTLKILIAEDNPTNQKVITAQLALLGQSADVTNNGAEAMAKLEDNDYDVVILDILMPVMGGEETIKAIRAAKQATSQHYCIALTASSYENQRERLLNLGFDAFLSKPLGLNQLASALNDVPRTLWVKPNFGGSFLEPTSIVDEAYMATFDFTFLKIQFGDAHKSIFKEIAPTFIDHAYGELAKLKSSAKLGDMQTVQRLSHSMKGAASSIGLTHLANALMQIENGATSSDVSKLISEVDQIMLQLKPIIQQELDSLARASK